MFDSQKVLIKTLCLSSLLTLGKQNLCILPNFSQDLSSSSTQLTELSWLSTSSRFLWKYNFLERQISVMSSRNPSRDFFCSRWASLSINLVVSIRLAVYNSKSSKLNGSASPFRRENLTTFKNSYPASLIAQSSAHCSSCQNPYNGEDEFAGWTSTKDSDHCPLALAMTRAPTSAVAPVVAPLIASSSADSSVIRYSKDNL